MNICILGISYCGSTLLSLILGSNDKIFSVGESSWLIKNESESILNVKNASRCAICENCDFWIPEFKKTLTIDNLFKSIQKRAKEKYNVDKVLYSDKNGFVYENYIQHNNKIDKFILLFKRPEGFVNCLFERFPNFTIKRALKLYYRGYYNNLNLIKTIDTKVIFYDNFVLNPQKTLKDLCNWIQISYSDKMLSYWNKTSKTHQIAGNANPLLNFHSDKSFKQHTSKWRENSRKTIKLDNKWKTVLSAKDLTEIRENKEAINVFNRLLKLTKME